MATNQGGGQHLEHNAADWDSGVLIIAFDSHIMNSSSTYTHTCGCQKLFQSTHLEAFHASTFDDT